LEQEVAGKPTDIPLYRSIQSSRLDPIEDSKVRIEQDFFAADQIDQRSELLRLGRRGRHGLPLQRVKPSIGGLGTGINWRGH